MQVITRKVYKNLAIICLYGITKKIFGGMNMLNTTLCYVLRGNEVLLLHRIKK